MLQHPYVLVSDDAQKNASRVAYSWRMNLPDDMSSANITIDGADAVLTDTLLPGEPRRLLVRLSSGHLKSGGKKTHLFCDAIYI